MSDRPGMRQVIWRLIAVALASGLLTALALILPPLLQIDRATLAPGQFQVTMALWLSVGLPAALGVTLGATLVSLVLWPLALRVLWPAFAAPRGAVVAATGLCALMSSGLILSVLVLQDMGRVSRDGLSFMTLVPLLAAAIATLLARIAFNNVAAAPAGGAP